MTSLRLVAKRRKRRRKNSRRAQKTKAAVVDAQVERRREVLCNTEKLQRQFARGAKKAEQEIERLERESGRVKRQTATFKARLEDADSRADAMIAELDEDQVPRAGFVSSLRTRFRAWRYRSKIRRLERSFERRDFRLEDQSSSALLAVVTERISRLSRSANEEELTRTVQMTEQIAREYRAHTAALEECRNNAAAELSSWQERVAIAKAAEEPELAKEALGRQHHWERQQQDATAAATLSRVGLRRIEDAQAQLDELVNRTLSTNAAPK